MTMSESVLNKSFLVVRNCSMIQGRSTGSGGGRRKRTSADCSSRCASVQCHKSRGCSTARHLRYDAMSGSTSAVHDPELLPHKSPTNGRHWHVSPFAPIIRLFLLQQHLESDLGHQASAQDGLQDNLQVHGASEHQRTCLSQPEEDRLSSAAAEALGQPRRRRGSTDDAASSGSRPDDQEVVEKELIEAQKNAFLEMRREAERNKRRLLEVLCGFASGTRWLEAESDTPPVPAVNHRPVVSCNRSPPGKRGIGPSNFHLHGSPPPPAC